MNKDEQLIDEQLIKDLLSIKNDDRVFNIILKNNNVSIYFKKKSISKEYVIFINKNLEASLTNKFSITATETLLEYFRVSIEIVYSKSNIFINILELTKLFLADLDLNDLEVVMDSLNLFPEVSQVYMINERILIISLKRTEKLNKVFQEIFLEDGIKQNWSLVPFHNEEFEKLLENKDDLLILKRKTLDKTGIITQKLVEALEDYHDEVYYPR